MTVSEAQRFFRREWERNDDNFRGSMGPKMEAAIQFLLDGGEAAWIQGTWIVPDADIAAWRFLNTTHPDLMRFLMEREPALRHPDGTVIFHLPVAEARRFDPQHR